MGMGGGKRGIYILFMVIVRDRARERHRERHTQRETERETETERQREREKPLIHCPMYTTGQHPLRGIFWQRVHQRQ